MEDVARLQDGELLARLAGWMARERALTARLLVHLGEVDARGLFRERAFPSMFEYAIEVLHMSEHEAYVRIRAARLGRQFPIAVHVRELGRAALFSSRNARTASLGAVRERGKC